jgi:hypothetical protein
MKIFGKRLNISVTVTGMFDLLPNIFITVLSLSNTPSVLPKYLIRLMISISFWLKGNHENEISIMFQNLLPA